MKKFIFLIFHLYAGEQTFAMDGELARAYVTLGLTSPTTEDAVDTKYKEKIIRLMDFVMTGNPIAAETAQSFAQARKIILESLRGAECGRTLVGAKSEEEELIQELNWGN